jgi:anti-sigma-K factor RskA
MNTNIINDYVLERYVLGELPGKRAKKIKKWLKTDIQIREKIEEIEESNREILTQYPPDFVVPKIMSRHISSTRDEIEEIIRPKPVFFKRILYASPAFAAALVIIFILFPLRKEDVNLPVDHTQQDEPLVKGKQEIDMSKPQLLVHRKRNDRIELLKNGARAKAGDLLQLLYIAAKDSHGVILSIDGNGNVTLHFPDKKNDPTSLEQDKKILLPNAIELDNAPAFERFFFITSGVEINAAEILKKAETLASNPDRAKKDNIDLPENVNQYSIIIIKGDRI